MKLLQKWFPVGTRSVLFGAHCFLTHPWFVAAAWTRLFGFPFDPRYWAAFFVHDLGYWGLTNIDGPEGEKHPEFGAWIMSWFDDEYANCSKCYEYPSDAPGEWPSCPRCKAQRTRWRDFSLYHSRYYAKAHGAQPSKLCFADKLSFTLTPRWALPTNGHADGRDRRVSSQRSEVEWRSLDADRF